MSAALPFDAVRKAGDLIPVIPEERVVIPFPKKDEKVTPSPEQPRPQP